ncbi:MAG TPA: hypothetical protein VKS20_10315 [Candidatus Acidoferrales bacterium]|nr:hypothetical protein [Candidatus Acidoferrales bacterium]
MRNPLVQYLIGACILSIGLVILLSSGEIAHGLAHFWDRWRGERRRANLTSESEDRATSYRARLLVWRVLGVLVVADGLIWLALASAEVLRLLPHRGR